LQFVVELSRTGLKTSFRPELLAAVQRQPDSHVTGQQQRAAALMEDESLQLYHTLQSVLPELQRCVDSDVLCMHARAWIFMR
jgi:hypothetical protein